MTRDEDAWRERGLIDAVRAGDESAWTVLYNESFAGLFSYVLWRCSGLRDRAEEVAQEVWLTAVQRAHTFKPEQGTFAIWLRGIAVNHLRNHFRRRALLRTQSLDRSVELPVPKCCIDQERAERVALALIELPDRYEAVLRAKYLDGLSVQAIAEERGESVKTIESLLTRARQSFREIYLQQESS